MPQKPISTLTLVKHITAAIQEKKGKSIVVADLNKLNDSVSEYFIICEGNSSTQVNAIVNSVEDLVRQNTGYKPFAVDGKKNSQWVAIDYGEIFVHVFLPEVREFYDLEHLWADAKLKSIPDID